jgi:hypothetical protein
LSDNPEVPLLRKHGEFGAGRHRSREAGLRCQLLSKHLSTRVNWFHVLLNLEAHKYYGMNTRTKSSMVRD